MKLVAVPTPAEPAPPEDFPVADRASPPGELVDPTCVAAACSTTARPRLTVAARIVVGLHAHLDVLLLYRITISNGLDTRSDSGNGDPFGY